MSSQKDISLFQLPNIKDSRGQLSFAELGANLPFMVSRCFWVYGVPEGKTRGRHAHKVCSQFLVAISGSVSVTTDTGITKREIVLNKPNIGLYIPPGVWGVQSNYSKDAILMVMTSHTYDAADYIDDYDDFLKFKAIK